MECQEPVTTVFPIALMFDAEGNYAIAKEPQRLTDAWDEEYSDIPANTRVVLITVRSELPAMIKVRGDLPPMPAAQTSITFTPGD